MQFTGTHVAAMEPIMDQLVLGWLDSLRNRLNRPNQVLCDIGEKIQFLTVDIITKVCLGDEIGCVECDRDMHHILKEVETRSQACQYFSVFLELNTLFFQLARIPVLRRALFPKPCGATGVGKLMGVSPRGMSRPDRPHERDKAYEIMTDYSRGSGEAFQRRL